MQYRVVLRRDEEGNWLVSVPAIPGCHTWGESREAAIANAQEAIEGCIESLVASGDPVPADESDAQIAVVSVS